MLLMGKSTISMADQDDQGCQDTSFCENRNRWLVRLVQLLDHLRNSSECYAVRHMIHFNAR